MTSILFTIRQETPNDLNEVYTLIKTAFKTAKVKDGDEQDFAVKLRESDGFIPELSLVAERDRKLIGHIMFTQTYVKRPDGSLYKSLLVAPLSVLLEHRNQEVGSALMREGFSLACRMGYDSAFLCGDPAYYNRFGFRQTTDFDIHPNGEIPPQFVMACELEKDALKGITGTIDFC